MSGIARTSVIKCLNTCQNSFQCISIKNKSQDVDITAGFTGSWVFFLNMFCGWIPTCLWTLNVVPGVLCRHHVFESMGPGWARRITPKKSCIWTLICGSKSFYILPIGAFSIFHEKHIKTILRAEVFRGSSSDLSWYFMATWRCFLFRGTPSHHPFG